MSPMVGETQEAMSPHPGTRTYIEDLLSMSSCIILVQVAAADGTRAQVDSSFQDVGNLQPKLNA